MADVKVSAMTAASALADADLVMVAQGGTSKKATALQVQTYVQSLVLAPTLGGTGLSTLTAGDVLYASAANTLAKLAKSASATRYLSNTGASNIPAWAQVALDTGVTGTLPETNGGTGQATFTAGDILYASAANTLSKLAKSTTTTHALLNTGASNIPAWGQVPLASGVSGTLPFANGGRSAYTARLSAAVTAMGTSYADVTGLEVAIGAGETWEFEWVLLMTSDATTTGIDVSMNGPASPTSLSYVATVWTTTTATQSSLRTGYDFDSAVSASAGTANRASSVKGVIVNGANAGNIVARAKREAVGSGPDAGIGSYVVARRLA